MIKEIGESEKIKFWENKVGECRQSGLYRKEFCEQMD